MSKKIVIAVSIVVALIGAFFAFVATRPDTFSVSRSIGIKAPPDKIFPHINDFHKWTAWSPFEKKDPNLKRTYSGAAEGVGSIYEWVGNDDVGSGRMEILETKPPNLVTIKLDFLKPFEGHNTAEFKIEPGREATDVTWKISGPVPFFAKILHLIFDMDKMIGPDFEAGLKSLKAISETPEAGNSSESGPAPGDKTDKATSK
jgi:Polyketide cyclase / dehydrase and lipid transport.